MSNSDLERVAAAMVAKNKGILAADESNATCAKRFEKFGIEITEENRRAYRELLFTTPDVAQWISGVILYDETIHQKTSAGVAFPEYLSALGIVPGIKVDTGAKALAHFAHETITEGLDGLRERLADYYKLGARFAKWRAVIDIGAGIPTRSAIEANAQALARYAALCQEQNTVPIVEPEVLMDGAHTIERCEEVTNAVLGEVFAQLQRHRIHLEGMVLKPNMVISGKKCPTQAGPEQVAAATVRTLKRHVPSAVPGIAFLSGGQSPTEAALHLSLMNRTAALPWQLTFSYGRALQDAAISTWIGKAANVPAAQRQFQKWARLNGLARSGAFQSGMEQQAA
ncbi:MAG: class I fructose-bisphosphate aldolase [Steroidobacteraceae bacterium]|jgi:fructose-bisphosphate aldolase class I